MQINEIDFGALSAAQLQTLIKSAQAALDNKSGSPVRVSIEFGSYNARRYSRPWIARITQWPVGRPPVLEFGGYVGNDSGGQAEILARPGSLVRYGQKDNRGNGGQNAWGIVNADGSVTAITESEARAAFGA